MALAAGALAATAGHLLAILGIDAIKNGVTATVERVFKDIELTDGLRATLFAYINTLEEPVRNGLNGYYEKARLNKIKDPLKEDRIADMYARCYLIKEDGLRKVAFEVLGYATDEERDAVLEFIRKSRLETWYLLGAKYGRELMAGLRSLYERSPAIRSFMRNNAQRVKNQGGDAWAWARSPEVQAWMQRKTDEWEQWNHDSKMLYDARMQSKIPSYLWGLILTSATILIAIIIGFAVR